MTLAANERIPGVYGDHNLSGASSSTHATERAVYLVGEYLGTGTATDGAIDGPIDSFADATAFFGSGSFGEHLAARALAQEGASRVPIYLVGIAEPAGVAAKGDLTFVGVAANAGTLVINFAGTLITVSIENAYTATNSGDAFVAAFNALPAETKPPFTCANLAGVVTATANNKGVNAGAGAGGEYGFGWKVVSWDVGTQTVAVDDEKLGKNTAGTLFPTLTNVAAALSGIRTHYLVPTCNQPDVTNGWQAYMLHIRTKSDSPSQLGSVLVTGSLQGTTQAIADSTTLNAAGDCSRLVITCCEDSMMWEPCQAAQAAIARAAEVDVSRPINGKTLSSVDAPISGSRFTRTEQNTLLAGGVTPLVAPDDSSVKIVRMVSAETSVTDPLDITVIETMDEFRDRCQQKLELYSTNLKIKETGQPIYTSGCTTPEAVLNMIRAVAYEMEREDKLQGVEQLKNYFTATLSGTRLNTQIPAAVVPGLHVLYNTFNLFLTLPTVS